MTPEERARQQIDARLIQSGWIIQDLRSVNPFASLGVAVREYPTSTGPVDYALFVGGKPIGVIEAKKDTLGENITVVEGQSGRYANSTFRYVTSEYRIRFAYEATGQLTRFTDYADEKYRSRAIFSFHRPETLQALLAQPDTIRNNMKHFPAFDTTGFRKCQITAIQNLDQSFAENRPKALVQMATGAGKTFTAITSSYRLLKYGKMKRILFLVDTKSLGEQAEREFLAYRPNDDNRSFSELYGVRRLKSSYIPNDIQICISTIQRMYSILKGEELDESAEEESFFEQSSADSQAVKEVVYNEKYPPEFFDCIIVDECHRSIYNVWKQVLEYFDAFLIGLTATPDKRTFAFFDQNIVSEYSREQAIIDGVNVGEDIFLIETDITKNGATILKQQIEYRDRMTRARRWRQMDEDLEYTASRLDRDVINPSQIRTVIRTFRECLFTQLFPHRREVPKTLIFAKTDSHADDIIQIVREEFGEGNEFCQKITCQAERPETVLSSFRNDFYPRIAVTVDMIATGTDVKPIREMSSIVTSGSRGWAKYYSDTGSMFIRIGNLTRDKIFIGLDDVQYVQLPENAEGTRTKLQPYDVLVSITADLGSIGLIPPDISQAYVNQHIAMIRFNNPEQGEFFAWYLRSEYGQHDLLKNKRGGGKLGLGLDDIRDSRVPVVSNETAKIILSEIDSRLSVCDSIEQTVDAALQQAEALRQSILKQAFEGGL